MFDCHVHSFFSCDSDMKPEAACDSAVEKGLDGIAFVDHLDYDFPGSGPDTLLDVKNYSAYMDDLKASQKNRLKILKGIEIGIQPHVIEKSCAVIKDIDFDFVIASIHIIDREDPHLGQYYPGKTKLEAYSRYLKEVLFKIRNFNDFDISAHFDYITRYPDYPERSLRYTDHSDLFDEIFKELIYRGKGFEVNTGSYKVKNDGRPAPVYDINILRRYRELGGEIVSLGSDAHDSLYIAYRFDYFRELIKDSGFKYLAHFENRKPVFVAI